MFWRLFGKERPIESALEGIVFKEGKGRLLRRFLKKRLLAYDEAAKCLRYYTPQRVLKGTIYLYDILFITPGRSSGRDVKKDCIFEITIPGRVYVFHVNSIRETKKWIGILSRELDDLKIKDRLQLNNDNIQEGTYSKALRPNSVLLNSLKIGDHREHEECCFLFDEEHQHKIIALESLCSVQAMQIYELSHRMEKFKKKCDELEVPPNEEITWLKEENKKLRFNYKREQIRTLDLRATIEEAEEKKMKEKDKLEVKKVEKHHHVDFVKVLQIEKSDTATSSTNPPTSPTTNAIVNTNGTHQPSTRNLISQSNKNNFINSSSSNFNNSANNKMEEIKRLTEELAHTKALLAQERARALESAPPLHFGPTPSFAFDTLRNTTTITTTTSTTTASSQIPLVPTSPTTAIKSPPTIFETSSFLKQQSTSSYNTFPNNPTALVNDYLSQHEQANHQYYQSSPSEQKVGNGPHANNNGTHSKPTYNSSFSADFNFNTNSQNSTVIHEPANGKSARSNNFSPDFNLMQSNNSSNLLKPRSNSLGTPPIHRPQLNGVTSPLVKSVTVNRPPPTQVTYDLNLSDSMLYTQTHKTPAKSPTNTLNNSTTSDYSITTSNASLFSSNTSTTPPTPTSTFSSPVLSRNTNQSNGGATYTNASLNTSLNTSLDSSTSSFANSVAEMLNVARLSDGDGAVVPFVQKLNEAVTEISQLSVELQLERKKVGILADEKSYMLDMMEDMKSEKNRIQKFKDEMEDLMETTEGKLNAMRDALEHEIKRRMAAEAELQRVLPVVESKLRHLHEAKLQDEIDYKQQQPSQDDDERQQLIS